MSLYDLSLLVNLITYIKLKNSLLFIPLTAFIAQKLVGPTKQLKQIIQIEHSIVKNPNWPEANQLAIYKHGWEFELVKQIQVVVRAELEPGNSGLRDQRPDRSATLPPAFQV